jgi:type IV pilus assembly protein PilW
MTHRDRTPSMTTRPRGVTLIELMISLVLASLIALAVMGVLGKAAQSRRSTHAVNDINQTGAYSMIVLDKWLRSAGSGFSQAGSYAFGCKLVASNGSGQILPLANGATPPAPFASVTTGTSGVFRLAPVVIAAGQTTPGDSVAGNSSATSDVLIVMSGHAGAAESPMYFDALSTSNSLTLKSTLGVGVNDLLLLADRQYLPTGVTPCMVTQATGTAASITTTTVALAGTYYAATVAGANLTDYSSRGIAMNIGNVAGGNPPRFALIGVGDGSTLYSYDLLQTDSTPLQPIAAGVFELHALYGVDTDGNGSVDSWQLPSATGYTIGSLMDGSAASATKLKQIVAIRVGLILRTNSTDSSQTAPASLSLFSDLGSGVTFTRTLSTTERLYRYRTSEATIPLRNALLAQ